MNNALKRALALALCLSLTLGAFVYRLPEAKAIALVDDAAIVTSVIVAVMVYGGYRFWLNNIDAGTFSDIIKPKVKQWNYQHGSSAEDPYSGFAEWSAGGMDNFRKSITPGPGNSGPDMKGLSWLLAGALFEKVCEFVEWLGKELGVQPGVEEPVPIAPPAGYTVQLLDGSSFKLGRPLGNGYYSPGDVFFEFPSTRDEFNSLPSQFYLKFLEDVYFQYSFSTYDNLRFHVNAFYGSSVRSDWMHLGITPYRLYCDRLSLAVENDNSLSVIGYNNDKYDGNKNYLKWCKVLTLPLLTLERIQGREVPSATLALPGTWSPSVPAEGTETVPMAIPGAAPAEALDVDALAQEILKRLTQNELEVKPSGSQIVDPGTQPDTKPSINPGTDTEGLGLFGWLKRIWQSIVALPAQIADAFNNLLQTLFVPDAALLQEISDAFSDKFGFFGVLHRFGGDLFGMTAETEPPVIWVHLENAESKYGYSYGDKQKILDLSWYQKYKANVDGILSGFLWLGYLWLLFKRAPGILSGMHLSDDDAPHSVDMPDVSSVPRLSKGGRSK